MTTAYVRVQFINHSTIRLFEKNAAGEPTGRFATIKTAIDFTSTASRETLAALVELVIRANIRIVKWLKGGRLK